MILTNEIFEYDIEKAGLSILYEKKKISKEEYEKYYKMDKKKRVIQLGLFRKERPDLSEIITEGQKEYTNEFIEMNNLKPHHILEIAHDAVWVSGIAPKKMRIGKYIKFVKKRTFDIQFIYNRRNIRIYYNTVHGILEVRGGELREKSKLVKKIKEILSAFEQSSDVYKRCHRIINKLIKNEKAYGEDMIKGLKNITLMRALLKEVVV